MSGSLRLRLFVIILVPLVVLSAAVGSWRVVVARDTANELFDRNLLLTAVAVASDVARGDGDAISPETAELLAQTAGGPVLYHVYGPDGVLVTGYAVPPIPISRRMPPAQAFAYYDAIYRGAPVRVLRIRDEAEIEGISGTFTITVWQAFDARNAFVWDLGLRSLAVIATLLAAVALLVWFGVRYGLKPLTDLEDAISRRSSEDLSPIQRAVPVEARGLVARLNSLFGKVAATLDAQAAFVSDAAHQLRNPIAGLRALGEAVRSAPDLQAARSRADDLVAAAARAGDLANRLLTLERARAEAGELAQLDLRDLVAQTVADLSRDWERADVALAATLARDPVEVLGDPLMLREALTNLIDNAHVHGGPALTKIEVSLTRTGTGCALKVSDDGVSVAPDQIPKILARFGQAEAGQGSGLGLSIADAVARSHGGSLSVASDGPGFAVTIALPLASAQRPTA